jgi:hypothetical protein
MVFRNLPTCEMQFQTHPAGSQNTLRPDTHTADSANESQRGVNLSHFVSYRSPPQEARSPRWAEAPFPMPAENCLGEVTPRIYELVAFFICAYSLASSPADAQSSPPSRPILFSWNGPLSPGPPPTPPPPPPPSRPILFVHGWCGSAYDWTQLFPFLFNNLSVTQSATTIAASQALTLDVSVSGSYHCSKSWNNAASRCVLSMRVM